MRPIVLISAGLGSVGALTGTGMVINHFYGGESIRAYVDRTKTSKNKIFLVVGRSDLSQIKDKYQESQDSNRPKPKGKDGTIVDKEKLVEWCNNNVDAKFSDEKDPTYLSVLSWCFVNSNTVTQEIESDNREIYVVQSGSGNAWQEAWDKYHANKDNTKKITKAEGSVNLTHLNGDDKAPGATALKAWCTANKTKKLYEDGVEEIYGLFKEWCTKEKQE